MSAFFNISKFRNLTIGLNVFSKKDNKLTFLLLFLKPLASVTSKSLSRTFRGNCTGPIIFFTPINGMKNKKLTLDPIEKGKT